MYVMLVLVRVVYHKMLTINIKEICAMCIVHHDISHSDKV